METVCLIPGTRVEVRVSHETTTKNHTTQHIESFCSLYFRSNLFKMALSSLVSTRNEQTFLTIFTALACVCTERGGSLLVSSSSSSSTESLCQCIKARVSTNNSRGEMIHQPLGLGSWRRWQRLFCSKRRRGGRSRRGSLNHQQHVIAERMALQLQIGLHLSSGKLSFNELYTESLPLFHISR